MAVIGWSPVWRPFSCQPASLQVVPQINTPMLHGQGYPTAALSTVSRAAYKATCPTTWQEFLAGYLQSWGHCIFPSLF